MRISVSQTPSNTPSNSPTITPSLTNCPTNTPTMTPTGTIAVTPTNTITSTPTNTQTRTPQTTPSNTPTNTNTPSNSATPTFTPTQTITPTCATYTVQYMQSSQQGNKDIRFTLYDNPDFTGNANAVCDYTISGTFDIDGGAINQPYTTIMAQNDHNHTYDTGSNITGFTITSVVPVCPCVLVIFQFITPTPSATQTLTPTVTNTPTITQTNTPSFTPTNTSTQTNTPSFTPTNTATPTMTPTTPEECPCNCWSLTYASGEMPAELEVRYRDCQLDTVQTQTILSLETVDNLDGTYTANICVQTGGTYNTPVCVSGSTEIICDPFSWVQGGVCCIPADCAIECCLIDILTNNSLDVEIDGVDVNGSPATLVGGVMPNEPGNGTTLCSTITGTVDIRISYSAGVSGQKITLCDSNGSCTCYNITGSGPGVFDFFDVVFDCITPVTILAEDGTC